VAQSSELSAARRRSAPSMVEPVLTDIFPKVANTAKAELEGNLQRGAPGAALEHARELQAKRRQSVELVYSEPVPNNDLLDALLQYARASDASCAQQLLVHISRGRWRSTPPVLALWSSPAFGEWRCSRESLSFKEEAALTLNMLACSHVAMADSILSSLNAQTSDSDESHPEVDPAPVRDSHKHFRRAAGIFEFLESYVKEELPSRGASSIDSPPPAERLPALARSMSKVCLAHADTLMACLAEARRSSPQLTQAMFVSAAGLFDSAASIIKKNSGEFDSIVDLNLHNSLVLGKRRSMSRAYTHRATAYAQEAEGLGSAVACIEEAVAHAENCKDSAYERKSWTHQHVLTVRYLKRREAHMREQSTLLGSTSPDADSTQLPAPRAASRPIHFCLHE